MGRSLVIGLLVLAILAFAGTSASAGGTPSKVDVVTVPSGPLLLLDPSAATQEVSILSIDVSVNVPGDEEWKAVYGTSWGPYCSAVIEAADNALYSQFDINLYVSTYQDWDSSDSQMDITKLLTEARNERGRNGKKLICVAYYEQWCGTCWTTIYNNRNTK